MLKEVGVSSLEELFAVIPQELRGKSNQDHFAALSEADLIKRLKETACQNEPLDNFNSFLGAGIYSHYAPAALKYLLSRPEFYTAYTPYQPECSQGTLQAIFEYQTYICELSGLDVSNASLYDGATALVEAVLMAFRIRKKKKMLIAQSIHPEYRTVLDTYLENLDLFREEVPCDAQGCIDIEALKNMCDDDTAALAMASPNFFGLIEDVEEINKIIKPYQMLSILVANPFALAVLREPGKMGVDIVCGEGQSLGLPPALGGGSFGFMAAGKEYLRQLPGRIVGETTDQDHRRAFCLTLQTREQHIRRQNATSNICSNHSHAALGAAMYLALMGADGIKKAAFYSMNLARYLREKLSQIEKVRIVFGDRFFHEFVWHIEDAQMILTRLHDEGILGGVHLGEIAPEHENRILTCCTETKTREDIDQFVGTLRKIIIEHEKEHISV